MADEMDYMEQAKELADSYRLLVHRRDMLRQQYEDSRSWFYTKDEIIWSGWITVQSVLRSNPNRERNEV